MLNHNTYGHIEAHYEKAVKKHPRFVDRISFWAYDKLANDNLAHFRSILKDQIDHGDVCAESVLDCELAEIYAAIEDGNMPQAIDECYDAIAVLLRIIDRLQTTTSEALK